MPFVQGNCPNCGGTLAVDNEKDAWVCPYCNTPFIVEKQLIIIIYQIQLTQAPLIFMVE